MIKFDLKKTFRIFGILDIVLALIMYPFIQLKGLSELALTDVALEVFQVVLFLLIGIGGYLHLADSKYKGIVYLASFPLRMWFVWLTAGVFIFFINRVYFNETLYDVLITSAVIFEMARVYLYWYEWKKDDEVFELKIKRN